MTLAELAEQSGTAARTIRFYISRGLLDGPVKAGRGAAYTGDHLQRLARIRALQEEGRTLTEIISMLEGTPRHAVPASPWWQYRLADDVVVSVSADISPWRAKQIRAVIEELAGRLAGAKEEQS